MTENNQTLIDNLPVGLKILMLSNFFDLPLDNLPNSLEKLYINTYTYNYELNNLPDSIELIKVSESYNKKITQKFENY